MIKYRSDIDGLRALAVLSVVIYHFNSAFLPAGFIGVDIFFVISGYLITGILLNTNKGYLSSLLGFYKSRFSRIIPAYLSMIIIVSIAGSVILTKNDYGYFVESLKYAFFFSSNFYFLNAGDYFSPKFYEYPLLHTWSLSIEMLFYFAWPIIVLIFRGKRNVLLFFSGAFIILSAASSVTNKFDILNNYYALIPRFTEILIGSFATLIEPFLKRKFHATTFSFSGILLLIISYTFIRAEHYPSSWYIFPCLGSALLLLGNNPNHFNIITNIFSARIFVNIGKWSYSIYLWHWPVLAYIRYLTGRYELSFNSTIAFLTITLLLSLVSYYLIESRKKTIMKKEDATLPFLVISYCLFFVLLTHSNEWINSFITRKSTFHGEYAKYDDHGSICHGQINGSCLRGETNSTNKILVIGDSHAAELNEFFNIYGKNNNIEYKILTSSSCVPIDGFNYHDLPLWAQQSCQMMIEKVHIEIRKFSNVILAGMWSYQLQSAEFYATLNEFIQLHPNKKFILVSQAPLLYNNLQRTLRLKSLNLPFDSSIDESYINANNKIKYLANKHHNVKYISTSEFFEQLNDFPFKDNKPLYFDNSHLNMFGVQEMAGYFKSTTDFSFE